MAKGSAGAHGPGTAAGTSPPHREDLAQDVLKYPNPWLTGAQGNLCCSPSCLWPPRPLPCHCPPALSPRGAWGGWAELHPFPSSALKSARGFLFFAADFSEKWSGACAWREGWRQRLSCSFSLNGRDSCSQWHELAYPTYMHLLASRQLRGTNQMSLFWFGGKRNPKPPFLCT